MSFSVNLEGSAYGVFIDEKGLETIVTGCFNRRAGVLIYKNLEMIVTGSFNK